jgi:hypothetical protein
MKRYKMKIPRMTVAVAALAMAVLAFGVMVVLPAMTSYGGDDPVAVATTTGAPTEALAARNASR